MEVVNCPNGCLRQYAAKPRSMGFAHSPRPAVPLPSSVAAVANRLRLRPGRIVIVHESKGDAMALTKMIVGEEVAVATPQASTSAKINPFVITHTSLDEVDRNSQLSVDQRIHYVGDFDLMLFLIDVRKNVEKRIHDIIHAFSSGIYYGLKGTMFTMAVVGNRTTPRAQGPHRQYLRDKLNLGYYAKMLILMVNTDTGDDFNAFMADLRASANAFDMYLMIYRRQIEAGLRPSLETTHIYALFHGLGIADGSAEAIKLLDESPKMWDYDDRHIDLPIIMAMPPQARLDMIRRTLARGQILDANTILLHLNFVPFREIVRYLAGWQENGYIHKYMSPEENEEAKAYPTVISYLIDKSRHSFLGRLKYMTAEELRVERGNIIAMLENNVEENREIFLALFNRRFKCFKNDQWTTWDRWWPDAEGKYKVPSVRKRPYTILNGIFVDIEKLGKSV